MSLLNDLVGRRTFINIFMCIKVVPFLLTILISMTVSGQKCEYSTEGPRTVPHGHISVIYKSKTVRVVKGTIIAPNREPLESIGIVLSKKKNKEWVFVGGAYSDEDGSFCFGAMPVGEYRIEVGRDGFNKAEILITVRHSGATENIGNITLEPGT